MKYYFKEHLEALKKDWMPIPEGASPKWLELRDLVLNLISDLSHCREYTQKMTTEVDRLTQGWDTKPFLVKTQVTELLHMLAPFEKEATTKFGNTLWAQVKYVVMELQQARQKPQFEDVELGWEDVSALADAKRVKQAYSLARNLVHRQIGLDTQARKDAMLKIGQLTWKD